MPVVRSGFVELMLMLKMNQRMKTMGSLLLEHDEDTSEDKGEQHDEFVSKNNSMVQEPQETKG